MPAGVKGEYPARNRKIGEKWCYFREIDKMTKVREMGLKMG